MSALRPYRRRLVTLVILAAAAGALMGELLPARPIGSATASPRTTHAGRAAPAHARPNR